MASESKNSLLKGLGREVAIKSRPHFLKGFTGTGVVSKSNTPLLNSLEEEWVVRAKIPY